MGLASVATAGFVVWIVLWALGIKAIDSFMVTVVILIAGLTVHMLLPYLPGKRDS